MLEVTELIVLWKWSGVRIFEACGDEEVREWRGEDVEGLSGGI